LVQSSNGRELAEAMAETPMNDLNATERNAAGEPMPTSEVEAWFVREVLPLEASLMRFLQSACRNAQEAADLRQDVYAGVIAAARKSLPDRAKPFVFATARNLLIDRVRHERVVSIDTVSDLDELGLVADEPGQDRVLIARDELRRLRTAIDALPPKCREAIVLRRIEGLSGREIASRMGIDESTVSHHINNGVRILAEKLYAEEPKRGNKP
jgi:RNA polymerase sigma-70 factor (ECF subfamily)